jgi:hypothetical protein
MPSLGEQHENGGHYRQHQYQTGDSDPDGEVSLRYANGIRIIDGLKDENEFPLENVIQN